MLFHNQTCVVCGLRFYRRQVVDCYPELVNTEGIDPEETYFSLLDQRLNEQDHDSFCALLDMLEATLSEANNGTH